MLAEEVGMERMKRKRRKRTGKWWRNQVLEFPLVHSTYLKLKHASSIQRPIVNSCNRCDYLHHLFKFRWVAFGQKWPSL
jgi:hypothetical protein